jgi:RNA polymerase sigma-70 factor (ECF subfamily)
LHALASPSSRRASVHRLPRADDTAVARALLEGQPGAPAVAWDRFSPLVRGLLRRSLGPGADVEDHVQEVFLRFFREIPRLREVSAVRSFLVGITVRVARSELRRRRVRRWLRLTDDGVLPETAAPSSEVAREALARLYALLDGARDEDRLAFVLRHLEGLELTEVAAGLGVSLATAKRRLARVTTWIRAQMAGDPVLADYLVPTTAKEDP